MEKKKSEAEKILNYNSDNTSNNFKIGDRVFHSKFGIGKILSVENVASSSMFIVDFGKMGQKALDASFSQLKKF